MTIIQNKTKITKKDISKFLLMASLQSAWLVAISAVVIALLGFSIENGTLIYCNYFFPIAAVCTVVIYLISVFFSVSKHLKNFKEIENEYSFNDDGVLVQGSTDGVTEKFDLKYSKLFKVKETSESYYLFVNNYSALIISKNQNCFTHGDSNKLKLLLDMKLNHKQNQLKKAKTQNKAKWLLYFFIFSKIFKKRRNYGHNY